VWRQAPERLDRALPALGLARSRSQAAELISGGRVRVDGRLAVKAGVRLIDGVSVEVDEIDHYVSRAAHKLVAGLDAFAVRVQGRLALDVGASTGGFTQVLCERGAREVIALDVGHGQLARALREDARVRAVEGCNARELTPGILAERSGIAEPPSLIVADLSFISLELVLPAMAAVCAAQSEFVLLIKPQFEVGRGGIDGGIVTDLRRAAEAIARVVRCAEAMGLHCRGVIPSPITGEHGNREVVAYFVRQAAAGHDAAGHDAAWQTAEQHMADGQAVPVQAAPETSEGAPHPPEWERHILGMLESGGDA